MTYSQHFNLGKHSLNPSHADEAVEDVGGREGGWVCGILYSLTSAVCPVDTCVEGNILVLCDNTVL